MWKRLVIMLLWTVVIPSSSTVVGIALYANKYLMESFEYDEMALVYRFILWLFGFLITVMMLAVATTVLLNGMVSFLAFLVQECAKRKEYVYQRASVSPSKDLEYGHVEPSTRHVPEEADNNIETTASSSVPPPIYSSFLDPSPAPIETAPSVADTLPIVMNTLPASSEADITSDTMRTDIIKKYTRAFLPIAIE
jgi:hypothetical protein